MRKISKFMLLNALCIALILGVHRATEEILDYGAVTKEDRKSLWPSINAPKDYFPAGDSVGSEFSIVPRVDHSKSLPEGCAFPTAGVVGEMKSNLFWLCEKHTKIYLSSPTALGNRKEIQIKPTLSSPLAIVSYGLVLEDLIIVNFKQESKFEIFDKDALLKEIDIKEKYYTIEATKAFSAPYTKDKKIIYLYSQPTRDQIIKGEFTKNLVIYKFDITTKEAKPIDFSSQEFIKKYGQIEMIWNPSVSDNFVSLIASQGGKTIALHCAINLSGGFEFEDCNKEDIYNSVKVDAIAIQGSNGLKVHLINNQPDEVIVVKLIDGGKVQSMEKKSTKGMVLDKLHLSEVNGAIDAGISWKETKEDPVTKSKEAFVRMIWKIRGTINGLYKAEGVPDEKIEELYFMFGGWYLGKLQRYEMFYNYFSFLILGDEIKKNTVKFDRDIAWINDKDYKVKIFKVKLKIDDAKSAVFSRTALKPVNIAGIKDSLVDYYIPEYSFRGNALKFSVEGSGVQLLSENNFVIERTEKTPDIEIIDDLYAQSISGNSFTLYQCKFMTVLKDKVSCNEIATKIIKELTTLKILSQVNNLEGIYTVFEGINGNIVIARLIKKILADGIQYTISKIFEKDLGSKKPDYIGSSSFNFNPLFYIGKGQKIMTGHLGADGGLLQKQTYDLQGKFPTSFFGAECIPKELSPALNLNEKFELELEIYTLFTCGKNSVVVHSIGLEENREISNFQNDIYQSCFTKTGLIIIEKKNPSQHKMMLFRNKNEGYTDYPLKDFGITKIEKIVCPPQGHGNTAALGTNSAGKHMVIVLNLEGIDPLKMIYAIFELDSFGKDIDINSANLRVSRYKKYMILTASDRSKKNYFKILNIGEDELFFTMSADSTAKFSAQGSYPNEKFEINFKVAPTVQKTPDIIQRKEVDFNKKGEFDLDEYFYFDGELQEIEVKTPLSLVNQISLKKRSYLSKEEISGNIHHSQQEELVQSGGHTLIMRSNSFETTIEEIKEKQIVKVFQLPLPCDKFSFDIYNNHGAIYISCVGYNDAVVYLEEINGVLKIKEKHAFFMKGWSQYSTMSVLDKTKLIVARTAIKNGDSTRLMMYIVDVVEGKLSVSTPKDLEESKIQSLLINR